MSQLDDLRLFVAAVAEGSLSAAGRRLERSPAVASAGLKRLELTLGVTLFARNTRRLRLTPAGEIYYRRIALALNEIDQAAMEIRDDSGPLKGNIAVTAPVDFVHLYLAPAIQHFREVHSEVRFSIIASDGPMDLVDRPLDMAVRYGVLADSGLVASRLCENARVLVASPDFIERFGAPSTPQDLVNFACLTYVRNNVAQRRWQFERDGETTVISIAPAVVCDNGAIVREMALQGAGIAYKSEIDVRGELQEGRLQRLLPDWRGESSPVQLVYPTAGPRPRRVLEFAAFLKSRIQS